MQATPSFVSNAVTDGARALGYLADLRAAMDSIRVTDAAGGPLALEEALGRFVAQVEASARPPSLGKLLLIGNGGSAAIASHVATDYMKNGGFRTLCFTDAALLTCLSNDFGYEHAYARMVDRMGDSGDILAAISSSGCSPNILNAVAAARESGLSVFTLSGFDGDNPLRSTGDINFYVRSHSYPAVEAVHMSVLDAVLQASVQSGNPVASA